ncbi:hypothetical protein BT93_J1855 [Corymbia citriodora subsp. variegata]|nr:hypothetical protein BT93_J1855 [Corymbia citriodora subsp. variegata]
MEDAAATKDTSTSAHLETNCPSRGKEGGPSLNSLALVRKSIQRTYISSDNIKGWRRAVYGGVLLKNETQKFWVDEKLHKNCFLVLPKACDIAGGNEKSRWYWITVEENCFPWFVNIYVPESKKLSWLLIQGRFETRALSPNTTYEVAGEARARLARWDQTDRHGETEAEAAGGIARGMDKSPCRRVHDGPKDRGDDLFRPQGDAPSSKGGPHPQGRSYSSQGLSKA